MKVLHVSFSDKNGGAAKAAWRICIAQQKSGIDAEMLVISKSTDHIFIHQAKSSMAAIKHSLRDFLVQRILRLQVSDNTILHSINLFPGPVLALINGSDADIVNLHWINNEMISIREIARIKKKLVWTLHDTWAFCGAEHCPADPGDKRYVTGYTKENSRNRKIDIDKWTWQRKLKHWKNKAFVFITPSEWMRSCVSESYLFKNSPAYQVYNPLDLQVFRPYSKSVARDILGLDPAKKYILFGAEGGTGQPLKGFDLLTEALSFLSDKLDNETYKLLIFGATGPVGKRLYGFEAIYAGRLYDETTVALLYAAADCMVVPSRLDNLPQTAVEAIACGTPVVAFHVGGLPEIIEHKEYGYLAQPYNVEDLGNGIMWVMEQAHAADISRKARMAAEKKFSEISCFTGYQSVYNKLINETN